MSAWMNKDNDPRIKGIASAIRVVPNFPKPGIMFKDITTLLLDPKAFKNTVDLFVEHYTGKNISVVAGTLPPFPFLTGENVTVPFWTSRILSDGESRPGATVRLH